MASSPTLVHIARLTFRCRARGEQQATQLKCRTQAMKSQGSESDLYLTSHHTRQRAGDEVIVKIEPVIGQGWLQTRLLSCVSLRGMTTPEATTSFSFPFSFLLPSGPVFQPTTSETTLSAHELPTVLAKRRS